MPKTKPLSLLQQDLVSCLHRFQQIAANTLAFCEFFVECIDRHKGAPFAKEFQQVSGLGDTAIQRMERIGRYTLDPRLLWGAPHMPFIERLSLEDQKRIIDTGVEVCFGKGGKDIRVLKLTEIGSDFIHIVVVNGALASVEQQRATLSAREDVAARVASAKPPAKRFRKSGVRINYRTKTAAFRNVALTLTELQALVQELQ